MNVLVIYAISFASTCVILTTWKVLWLFSDFVRQHVLSMIRKILWYTLVLKRKKGSSDISIIAAFAVVAYISANIFVAIFRVSSRQQLADRCGHLFMLNLGPLFLGGRTNFILDKVLRISIRHHTFVHHWIGRVCVGVGVVHAVIQYSLVSRPTSLVENLLLAFLASIGVLSILWLRRYVYELFLKSHSILALGLLICLWLHLDLVKTSARVLLGTTTGLWLFQSLVWLAYLIYRNFSSVTASLVEVEYFGNITRLSIRPGRKWKVLPGQYVYLTIPGLGRHRGGFLQAHPYSIAWVNDSSEGKIEIHILVSGQKGFSSLLSEERLVPGRSLIIDGPYGRSKPLGDYDKVLFIANGIGVAAHFLTIKELLESHKKKTARVRRLTLIWKLDTEGQKRWAGYLRELLIQDDRNKRQVFSILLFLPGYSDTDTSHERLVETHDSLDLDYTISKEWDAEAGNMAISICGTPLFERDVRRAVRRSQHNIHLTSVDFQPEETEFEPKKTELKPEETELSVIRRY